MAIQNVRTIDHQAIREWVEGRGGNPAVVADTGGEGGLLRIDFGLGDEALEPVSWEEFFRIFDENGLAFVYEQEPDDAVSFTCTFVSRDNEVVDETESMDVDDSMS